ncbi:MAG: FIST C-terminal domain-containing protein [Chloroflexota bacterium]|nr:FIST C-terminal domain-containing protein [Chloroflexota bacterium]
MRWASAISQQVSVEGAVEELAAAVDAQLDGLAPDLLLAFTTMHYLSQREEVVPALRRRFPGAAVAGCTGAGVIGAGREVEDSSAFSLTAAHLPEVALNPFHIDKDTMPSPDAPPDAWTRVTGVEPDAEPHFILLADPFSIDGEELLAGLDFAFPASPKIGGLASGGQRPNVQALYADEGALAGGAVGVALSGNVVMDTIVAQGCRPVGRPLRVTAADRNILAELDGEPALQALQETFAALSPPEQRLAQRNLFIGLAPAAGVDIDDPGEYLIRNLLGADPDKGLLAVGALPSEGQIVRFHVRDAQTSADDLRALLRAYAPQGGATGALLFSCTGRGVGLYGEPGHDSALFRDEVGAAPVGGFFCNGEIGPVGGTTYLHGYTSSFGIFRPRAG